MKKITCILLCTLILMWFLIGCSSDINEDLSFNEDNIDNSVIKGNTELAFHIFKGLNNKDRGKNIFISPISISTALTMTYQGAETTTKKEMISVLEYKSGEKSVLNESYNNLLRYLRDIDKGIELDINNSIWIGKGKKINSNFIDINKKVFDAYVNEIDFSKKDSAKKN